MKKTAIIFSSTDGHTEKICKKITDILQHASMVSLSSIEEADSLELENFDFIIIGASIRYGKHKPNLFKFINKNLEVLNKKQTAFLM